MKKTNRKSKWGKAEFGMNVTPDQLRSMGMSESMITGMQDGYEMQQQMPQETASDNDGDEQPPAKGRTFKTPGTGDLMAAGLQLVDGLLPQHQSSNQYHKNHYGAYSANPYGTGSHAQYADGGTVGTHKIIRKQGGITVTEEVPDNLGYGAATPQMVDYNQNHNVHITSPPVQQIHPLDLEPKRMTYEQLTLGGAPIYAPKFLGNWSQHDIDSNWDAIPDNIGGANVLKGSAWRDLQQMPDGGTITPAPTPAPVQRNISYETLQRPDHTTMYAPVFNGNWSYNDVKNAWNTIPENMNGSPVLRGESWNSLYDGVKPGTSSSQWRKKATSEPVKMLKQYPGNMPRSASFNVTNDRYEDDVQPITEQNLNAAVVQRMAPSIASKMANGGNVNGSVVDFLNSKGQDSSKEARARLAKQYGISNYDYSASKNTELLSKLRGQGVNSSRANSQRPITSQSFGVDNSYYKMDEGFLVDKRTGRGSIIKNHQAIQQFPVITGGNVESDEPNLYTPGYQATHPELRNTPQGEYNLIPDNDIYNYRGFDVDNPELSRNLGVHVTYDPATRNPYYTSDNQADRNASYGCVNCQKGDIDKLYGQFPRGTKMKVIDSGKSSRGKQSSINKAAASKFIPTGALNSSILSKYGMKENGGNIPQFEFGGNMKVGDEVDLTPSQIKTLIAQGYQFDI